MSVAMVPFGKPMRDAHFNFATSYVPLNHGSFGTFPNAVRDHQRGLQSETEARPDTFIRFTYPKLLLQARQAVAPLLGADVEEVVFVPNALTGINTVLRNQEYVEGDVILHFSTIYGGCLKTIRSLEETTPVRGYSIDLVYPIEDDDIVRKAGLALSTIMQQGRRVVLAMFDTVLTFPGVRFPWESLVQFYKQHDILTCIDAAHGIGNIDLAHLGQVGPDFVISNCYKKSISQTQYFASLFEHVSTIDTSPYLCVFEALKFRNEVCGGEEQVRAYSIGLAKQGGELMAMLMGTEVLKDQTGTQQECCFTNVRLPLDVDQDEEAVSIRQSNGIPHRDAQIVADWITERSVNEFDTYIAVRYYAGGFWTRLSGQIYLDRADFAWAAGVLLELSARAERGDWKSAADIAPVSWVDYR
ncbi:hypothetical protein EKO27_g10533 [Xylaria grammica]|uniref:Aminotransferase class V domain-containing protein n=1 Tax=Xylaria grammica TaxID=363999 RepID=A0A439CQY0_9PEZI|nr:hypothetical protein EKO27_g10533 [Xylaria grammica]